MLSFPKKKKRSSEGGVLDTFFRSLTEGAPLSIDWLHVGVCSVGLIVLFFLVPSRTEGTQTGAPSQPASYVNVISFDLRSRVALCRERTGRSGSLAPLRRAAPCFSEGE
jgi:hypothetical protein